MKESQSFRLFFQQSFLILLSCLALGGLLGYMIPHFLPVTFLYSIVLEGPLNKDSSLPDYSLAEKTSLVDEAVVLLRSANLQQNLGIDGTVVVNAVRISPYSMRLETKGVDSEILPTEMKKLQDHISLNFLDRHQFEFRQVGSSLMTSQKFSPVLGLVIGLGIGMILGLFVSLLGSYFQKF